MNPFGRRKPHDIVDLKAPSTAEDINANFDRLFKLMAEMRVDVDAATAAAAAAASATPSSDPELITAFTPPVDSQFSWVNQGTSTLRVDTSSVVLLGTASGNVFNQVCRVKSIPAFPYTITAYFLGNLFAKGFQSYGFVWRDSVSAKLACYECFFNTTNADPLMISRKFTNPTTFSADYTNQPVAQLMRWMRIKDDGTSRICQFSSDGVDWQTVHTIGRTDFLTADQVGFCVSTHNSVTPNVPPIVRVCSWAES